MKIFKSIMFLFLIIILSTSVFSLKASVPLYIGEIITTDEDLNLIQKYEATNPYYAKNIIIFCVPEKLLTDMNNLRYDFNGNNNDNKYLRELCDNGSFNKDSISSIKLNNEIVNFSFIDIDKKELFYENSKLNEFETFKVIKIETYLYNGETNNLQINNYNFTLKYSNHVYPTWSLAFIGIILGFIGLFIKKIEIKKKILFFSILFIIFSFGIIHFNETACEYPSFIFIGIFTLIFFIIIILDFLQNTKNNKDENKTLLITYSILLFIFIIMSYYKFTICWVY